MTVSQSNMSVDLTHAIIPDYGNRRSMPVTCSLKADFPFTIQDCHRSSQTLHGLLPHLCERDTLIVTQRSTSN